MRALSIESRPTSRPVRADGLHDWLLSPTGGHTGAPSLLFKQLLPFFAEDEGLRERWLQVVERNTELAHPSCSNVLDFGAAAGNVYLVSRYGAGLPLSTLVQTMRDVGEPMAHELVAHIGSELLGALAYVHASDPSLTHLDLDPAGLLVQADGSLLMSEFGLWSVLSPAELARCRFDAGRVQYSAPELVRSRPSDARSDIFSVGVLLYELLSGQLPFEGKTQLLVAMAIAEGRRRPLREVAPLAPESLCDIVEMMLATEASDRFQSAAAAQQALVATSMVLADAANIRRGALAALHAAVPNTAWTVVAEEPTGEGEESASDRPPRNASFQPSFGVGFASMSTAATKDVPTPAGSLPRGACMQTNGPAAAQRLAEPLPPPLLFASGVSMETPLDSVESGAAQRSTLPPAVPAPGVPSQDARLPSVALPAAPSPDVATQGGAPTRDLAASSDLAVNDGRTEHLRPLPEQAKLRAPGEPSRPRSVPRLWPRAATEPSEAPRVPDLWSARESPLPRPPAELGPIRAAAEPSQPQPAPGLWQARAAAELSRPPSAPNLWQVRAAQELSASPSLPELPNGRGMPQVSQARAETVDAPKPPKIVSARPAPALSAALGSEGAAFRLPRPAFRGGSEASSPLARASSAASGKSHSFSPQGGTPAREAPWSPPRPAGKWQDPSATLFQLKRPSKSPRPGRKAQAPVLAVALLSALFGFSAVAGVYLVFRLFQ